MRYILAAVVSAFFFGASTPLSKLLLNDLSPFQLAGFLYIGSAVGVWPFSKARGTNTASPVLDRKNLFYLAGAVLFGGILGPVLLLMGLEKASGVSVSMWLNLELAATALLGVFLFRDHLGFRAWIGTAGTIAASVLLTGQEGAIGVQALLLVSLACICWALDNHFTALIDHLTPSRTTFFKGIAAGCINLIIALALAFRGAETWGTNATVILGALLVGAAGYGLSISLYITAAQHMGATRSQMIFASAPFFGVALSVPVLGEGLSWLQILAALILTGSLFVLFLEKHAHEHDHSAMRHLHYHRHSDGHHNHVHPDSENARVHGHWHHHDEMSHAHPHWPDIHHRHDKNGL